MIGAHWSHMCVFRADQLFILAMYKHLFGALAVYSWIVIQTATASSPVWNTEESCTPVTLSCADVPESSNASVTVSPSNCTCLNVSALCLDAADDCISSNNSCPMQEHFTTAKPTTSPDQNYFTNKTYVLEPRATIMATYNGSCMTTQTKNCSGETSATCHDLNRTISRIFFTKCSTACKQHSALVSVNKTLCEGECYDSQEVEFYRCGESNACLLAETRLCYNQRTCVGRWTRQTNESCSKSCGNGTRGFTNVCVVENNESYNCAGSNAKRTLINGTESCNSHACPAWSSWSKVGSCSSTCNTGRQASTRKCMYKNQLSNLCSGNNTKMEDCVTKTCLSLWSPWRVFAKCNSTLEARTGVIQRTRTCYSGNEKSTCNGKTTETRMEPCDWCNSTRASTQCLSPCSAWSTWTEHHCGTQKGVLRRYCLGIWDPRQVNPHCMEHDYVKPMPSVQSSCFNSSGVLFALLGITWSLIAAFASLVFCARKRKWIAVTFHFPHSKVNKKKTCHDNSEKNLQSGQSGGSAEKKTSNDEMQAAHYDDVAVTPKITAPGTTSKSSEKETSYYVIPNLLLTTEESNGVKPEILQLESLGSRRVGVAEAREKIRSSLIVSTVEETKITVDSPAYIDFTKQRSTDIKSSEVKAKISFPHRLVGADKAGDSATYEEIELSPVQETNTTDEFHHNVNLKKKNNSIASNSDQKKLAFILNLHKPFQHTTNDNSGASSHVYDTVPNEAPTKARNTPTASNFDQEKTLFANVLKPPESTTNRKNDSAQVTNDTVPNENLTNKQPRGTTQDSSQSSKPPISSKPNMHPKSAVLQEMRKNHQQKTKALKPIVESKQQKAEKKVSIPSAFKK